MKINKLVRQSTLAFDALLIISVIIVGAAVVRGWHFMPSRTVAEFTCPAVIVKPVQAVKTQSKTLTQSQTIALSSPTISEGLPLNPPKILNQVVPAYPAAARQEGIEGTVAVCLTVAPDGKVSAANLVNSSGSQLLDDAALHAASQWTFAPARSAGAAVLSVFEVPITFRLND
jgi:protein TonB